MVQLLLIRPGATEYDQQGRIQGTLDVPLCEDGRQEVARLVEQLREQPVAAIYMSPCQSAVQTAEALATTLNVKAKTIDKFENVDQGLWQGLLVDEVKAKQPRVYRQWQEQPETVCPPQGETLGAARQRVQAALSKLIKKHKTDAVVALVTPEPLASVIRNVLGQSEWGDLWHPSNSKQHWQLIEVPETVEVK